MAIQPDGRIVVVGPGKVGPTNTDFAQACLMRLTAAGALDPSFGVGGKATTPFGGPRGDFPRGVVLLHNGKIAVGGYLSGVNSSSFALAVLKPDGTADTTFDGDGRLGVDFDGARDFAYGIALQPDGSLVLAGYTSLGSLENNPNNFAVARVGADPPVDVSFDADGRQETAFGTTARGVTALIQPDGKTVVAAMSMTPRCRWDLRSCATAPTAAWIPPSAAMGVRRSRLGATTRPAQWRANPTDASSSWAIPTGTPPAARLAPTTSP